MNPCRRLPREHWPQDGRTGGVRPEAQGSSELQGSRPRAHVADPFRHTLWRQPRPREEFLSTFLLRRQASCPPASGRKSQVISSRSQFCYSRIKQRGAADSVRERRKSQLGAHLPSCSLHVPKASIETGSLGTWVSQENPLLPSGQSLGVVSSPSAHE